MLINDNEVRKAPDALLRVPEMLDTPPNRYHCISNQALWRHPEGFLYVLWGQKGGIRLKLTLFYAGQQSKITVYKALFYKVLPHCNLIKMLLSITLK